MESLSIEQINKLQEENEAYKQSEQEASEIIAELKHALTRLCYQQHGDSCRIYELKESKFKAALEEIREMAEYDCLRECSNDSEYCTVISCLEKRIQNKINEVLK